MINLLLNHWLASFFAITATGDWIFVTLLIPIKCELHCAIILFDYSASQSWIDMAGCLARFLFAHAIKD